MLAGPPQAVDGPVVATGTPSPMAMATTATPSSTVPAISIAPSEYERIERLQQAKKQLVLAATILVAIVFVSCTLIYIKIRPKSTKDDEPGLTYAMPAPTVTASQDVREPETTEEAPVVTPYKKKPLVAQPLLCTYGAETNTTTLFPGDGLCDLIFYDSAYKHNRDIPNVPSSFSESMNAVLSHSSNYKATEIGIGFTYDHMVAMRSDMKSANFLQVFWDRNVFHFGIIDVPSFGIDYEEINDVFTVLKELGTLAQKRPNALEPPYIALGAVPLKYGSLYAAYMKKLYSPTLFISQGHYAFGDSYVPDCKVLPPTLVTKPIASVGYLYDLRDAVNALKQTEDAGGSAKWLISVGMKGRWTEVDASAQLRPSSSCKSSTDADPFGSYAEVCADPYLNSNLKYSDSLDAMFTFHFLKHTMFMYDDERALCRKLCYVQSRQRALRFGIAVYDLEYEDYNNNCTARNRLGAFSRLKMVRKIVDQFRSSPGGGDCENDVPCP